MNNDLISIVIPVYNVEKYLDECIQSLQKQTYTNIEIILVDDGSTDNSGMICDKYAKTDFRIKVIHKQNGGMSDARNVGIDNATGKYIQFIDSDDYFKEDLIESLYKDICENNADIALCSHYIVTGNNITTDATYEKRMYTREEVIQEFLLDTKIRAYVWNKLFKKSLFDEIKFPVGRVFEDQLIIPKLFAKADKIILNDIPLYYYRQREGSVLHNQTKELRIAYIEAAFEMHDYVKTKVKNIEKFCNYNIAHIAINTYNDIGLFKMYDLAEEKIVQELYFKFKHILKDNKMEKFIMENSSNVKKIHYYYLLENSNKYIQNNRYLPAIYPEHKDLTL